ncbi:MAG: hypothetical protein J6R04_03980 [Clostridia bacterium]|nr:hypothetical protein [Clostridia bacterium]
MTSEQLRGQFVPIIVGGNGALSLAGKLFWRFGLTSHLLTAKPPLLRRLCPWLCVHSLPDRVGYDVLLVALGDLASELAAEDRTPLLFWCADEPLSLDDERRLLLEAQLIFCREDKLDDLALVVSQGGMTQ